MLTRLVDGDRSRCVLHPPAGYLRMCEADVLFSFPGLLFKDRLKKGNGFTKLVGLNKAVHPSDKALGIVMGRKC